jgi:ribose transport system substrate-binding protein
MVITGLGPHGERAVPADRIVMSEAEAAAARAGRFSVAVVLHTTASDWSSQELAGMASVLGSYSAAVVEVVDCGFDMEVQSRELKRLAQEPVDAVVSIPIGNAAVAEAHLAISRAGKTLVLLDNAPTGMRPGVDYACVVSTDNFGLGTIAAELLSPHLREEAVAGIVNYGVDFFATHEREIAFRKWMQLQRPDVTLVRSRFQTIETAGAAFEQLLAENNDLEGLFVTWDEPAIRVLSAVRARGLDLPITTVDLGVTAATELSDGGLIKGIAAQRPYEQGTAAGVVTLLALIGRFLPPWIALPGLAVTDQTVIEAYQMVWHAPAPPALLNARKWNAPRQATS